MRRALGVCKTNRAQRFFSSSNGSTPLGFHHVDFFVGNSFSAAYFYRNILGLNNIAQKGLETGDKLRSTQVVGTRDVSFSFTSPVAPDHEFDKYYSKRGDSVRDVALTVGNAEEAYQRALNHGALPVSEPRTFTNPKTGARLTVATIRPPFAEYHHSFISGAVNDAFSILPHFESVEGPSSSLGQQEAGGVEFLDHLALAIEKGSLSQVYDFYKDALGFERFLCSDDDGSGGLAIRGARSGLHTLTMCSPCGKAKVVLVEPAAGEAKSQIQEFLDYNAGPGIAHFALHTRDIVSTVRRMRGLGVPFISVPPTYYERRQQMPQSEVIPDDLWTNLREQDILVDFGAHRTEGGDAKKSQVLLQTFTLPLCGGRPTYYLEVIERRGADGFGRGNITALFEAIETLQERRGNL